MGTAKSESDLRSGSVHLEATPTSADIYSDLLSSSEIPEGTIGTSKPDIEPLTPIKGSEANGSSKCQPWIRYRTELRHRITGDLIHRTDSDKPHHRVPAKQDNQPIFELITRYETVGSELDQAQEALQGQSAGQTLDSAPSYFLKIYSSAIINALRSVVQYYPSQDLSGSSLEIKSPYPVLVHHYDALHDFKANCDAKNPNELCVHEKDASAHLTHLLYFMDENIMERVRAEQERLKAGFQTFENQWIVFKPGNTIVFKDIEGKWKAFVVQSVTGGTYQNSTSPWKVLGWHLKFDGRYLGRVAHEMIFVPFDGVKSLGGTRYSISDREDIKGAQLEELISHGEMYFSLLMTRMQCRYHKGKMAFHPYTEVRRSFPIDILV